MRIGICVAAIAAIAGNLVAGAQTLETTVRGEVVRADAPAFGTTASILTLPAVTFQLVAGVEGPVDTATDSRSCASDAPCAWVAGVSLPSGSRITALELEACDGDSASKVSFGLRRHPVPMQNAVPVVNAGTGIVDTPGCALFPAAVDHTVDNGSNTYVVEVSAAPGTDVRFGAVRVVHLLQVSPAPASATFTDVPASHPFFQFIEALAASHITAGCGNGKFCPDDPLTRGQMAVFLSTALGLSFPN